MKKKLSSGDWEKAGGAYCSSCGEEVVRLVGGLCPVCQRTLEKGQIEKRELASMRRYYSRKLRDGTISLSEMRVGHL